jgi:hypothetical protein
MKKWGLVLTLLYGVLVLAFLVPAMMFLASGSLPGGADLKQAYASGIPWICAGAVMLGEAVLLWLGVDTTQKRLKPRTHILISALTTGLFMSILTIAIVLAIGLGLKGEKLFPQESPGLAATLSVFAIPWLIWGILFYRFCRNSTDPVTRAVAWLFRGSVLELLIALPAHVVIRRRHDCSAPVVNSWGIASGVAVMLISFGPSVLLLYKKRMERYSMNSTGAK